MPLIGVTPLSFYAGLRPPLDFPGQPKAQFDNGGFENDFDNWEVYNERVSPGGVVPSVIITAAGCPIPADPTPFPSNGSQTSPGQSQGFSGGFESVITSGGPNGKYAQLQITFGTVDQGGQTVYGPMIVSKSPVIAEVGDRISFNWTAQGGGDAYNVLAYIIDPAQSCRTFIMVDETGNSGSATKPWTNVSKVIGAGEAGNYFFVFVCGTFDFSFGMAVGALLGVDEVKIEKAGTY